MANFSIKECRSALLTPTNIVKFQFPPRMPQSAGRLQVYSNFDRTGFDPSRRSFTPNRNSLFLKSPDLSPIDATIESYFRRAPPESIEKASADTTVNISTDDLSAIDEFTLMPPPKGKPRKTANFLSVNRERSPKMGTVNELLKRQEIKMEIVNLVDDLLNTNVSLNSLLMGTGLTQYIDIFERAEIDLEILFTMSDQDLQLLGIRNAEDRDILLKFKNIFESSFS